MDREALCVAAPAVHIWHRAREEVQCSDVLSKVQAQPPAAKHIEPELRVEMERLREGCVDDDKRSKEEEAVRKTEVSDAGCGIQMQAEGCEQRVAGTR